MQENEFEKQVQKLMGDLRIQPSEPVWNYVEKRIPKSNRRRRFAAFILLFAGVAVCGYFFYQKFYSVNYTDAVNTMQENSISANNNAANEKNITQDSLRNTTDVLVQKDNNNTIDNKKENNQLLVKDSKQINDDIRNNTKNSKTNSTFVTLSKSNDDLIIGGKTNNLSTNKQNTTTGKNIIDKKDNSYSFTTPDIDNGSSDKDKKNVTLNTENPVAITEEKTHENAELKTETLHDSVNRNTDQVVDTTKALTEAKKQPKDIKKITIVNKKLQWGTTGFFGVSNIIEGININALGIGGEDKSYMSNDFITGIPSATRFDSIVYANQAKNIKARKAFSIGVTVRKNISVRSSFTTGIEFTRINTQIQTGNIKDTSAVFYYNNSQTTTNLNTYYTPGINSSKINSYNFIQIPLIYSYQLNKSKKLPLTIDAGLAISRLISSNAVVYDSYNQAYYKNNDLFYKTQVQLLGGFNIQFSLPNKSNIVIGPQLQYGLTGVVKNSNSDQHFFMWGLRTRYYLKSK